MWCDRVGQEGRRVRSAACKPSSRAAFAPLQVMRSAIVRDPCDCRHMVGAAWQCLQYHINIGRVIRIASLVDSCLGLSPSEVSASCFCCDCKCPFSGVLKLRFAQVFK